MTIKEAKHLWYLNHKQAVIKRIMDKRRADPAYRKAHSKSSFKYKKRRRIVLHTLFNKLKIKPCADCQGWFEPCQMDFDHNPLFEKKLEVSKMIEICRPIKTILEEIKKCDLVCSNCHRLRTYKRRALKKMAA